jgi:hypothetical protein
LSTITSVWKFIQFIGEAWPVIKYLFDIWKKTPEEIRNITMNKVHKAIEQANASGNTSEEEDLISRGKPR